jgi:hypothetical protein
LSNNSKDLKKKLLSKNCFIDREGRGDHEIWFSPVSGNYFIVEDEIKSSHTAEAVLKIAGLDKAF